MPWNWLSTNWVPLSAIGGFIFFLWRIHRVLSTFETWGENIQAVRRDTALVIGNHIPHLKTEAERLYDNITGLRTDVKDGFSRLTDSMNVVLSRME